MPNTHILRPALVLGVLTWLIPFVLAFPFFESAGVLRIDFFLFKSIMLIVAVTTWTTLTERLLRAVPDRRARTGLLVGLLWIGINWMLDLAILVPMEETDVTTWFTRIGLGYLVLPVIGTVMGRVADNL